MTWCTEYLGKYIEVKHGFAFKGDYFTSRGKLQVLTPGNIHPRGGLKLNPGKDTFYSGRFPDEFLFQENDLFVVMTDLTQTASILGGAACIPESNRYLHNQRLGKISIKNPRKLNKQYLTHFLNWQYFRDQVKASSNGATVKHTSPGRLYKCKILLPGIREQQKIAAILTAYDDLIENNRQRIALLEKMAEEIYREWFVRLRFPGHEHTPVLKGVPEGWSERVISGIVNFKSGFAFKSRSYESGAKYGIVTIKNVHDGKFIDECSDQIPEPPSRLPKHCFLKNGDMLMSLTGNVGRVCIATGENFLLNQRVALLEPKDADHSHYVYWLFRQKSMTTFCEMISTGAAQQNLSPFKLGAQKVICPSDILMEKYQHLANPLMEQIGTLLSCTKKLQKTRDLLLNRLISGKLRVDGLDIQFPPSMRDCADRAPG